MGDSPNEELLVIYQIPFLCSELPYNSDRSLDEVYFDQLRRIHGFRHPIDLPVAMIVHHVPTPAIQTVREMVFRFSNGVVIDLYFRGLETIRLKMARLFWILMSPKLRLLVASSPLRRGIQMLGTVRGAAVGR